MAAKTPKKSCFNTQPTEGGWGSSTGQVERILVSTHSRPKAAGYLCHVLDLVNGFQHTAARRRLGAVRLPSLSAFLFQHTAARRRLEAHGLNFFCCIRFQHTAARRRLDDWDFQSKIVAMFQHTAARRRLGVRLLSYGVMDKFQHTAARRRLDTRRRHTNANA